MPSLDNKDDEITSITSVMEVDDGIDVETGQALINELLDTAITIQLILLDKDHEAKVAKIPLPEGVIKLQAEMDYLNNRFRESIMRLITRLEDFEEHK